MDIIGIIGAGNMGGALARGMLKKGAVAAENLIVYDADRAKLESFTKETGASTAAGNVDLVEKADIVILAVKPDIAPGVLAEVSSAFTCGKLLLSIVLGLSLEKMSALSGGRARCARCMPNTPALVNEGMTCVAMGEGAEPGDKETVAALLGSVGMIEFMKEKDLEKVTALTGSSPAYVFMFIEAMADAAVLSGLPRDLSYKLASQAVLGSAKMALESGRRPAELKDMVCSPAGSTIEAVRVLEAKGFRSAVIEAMRACDLRAREIAGK